MTTTLRPRSFPVLFIVLAALGFWGLVLFAGVRGALLSDPADILTQGAQATAEADSLRFEMTLDGELTDPSTGTPLPLEGVAVSGEVDMSGEAAHLTFSVPSLFGLSGEAIVIGRDSYVLTSMTGDKWVHSTSEEVPEPTEPPTEEEIADKVAELLATEGVTAEKLDDVECGDDTCYLVRLSIPADVLAEHGGMPGMGDMDGIEGLLPEDLFGGPVVLDLQFQHEGLWLRQVSTAAEGGEGGSFQVTVDFSDYNASFNIAAPPADQVTEEGDFPFFQ